jgi:hypothetical protein
MLTIEGIKVVTQVQDDTEVLSGHMEEVSEAWSLFCAKLDSLISIRLVFSSCRVCFKEAFNLLQNKMIGHAIKSQQLTVGTCILVDSQWLGYLSFGADAVFLLILKNGFWILNLVPRYGHLVRKTKTTQGFYRRFYMATAY